MTRPSQIRRIVAELRRALGPEVAAWELLQLAAIIVEAHREPEAFDGPIDRRPFYAMDVDIAFRQNNGWNVLNFERRQGMAFSDELPDNHYRTQSRLQGFIGRTVWPRIETD